MLVHRSAHWPPGQEHLHRSRNSRARSGTSRQPGLHVDAAAAVGCHDGFAHGWRAHRRPRRHRTPRSRSRPRARRRSTRLVTRVRYGDASASAPSPTPVMSGWLAGLSWRARCSRSRSGSLRPRVSGRGRGGLALRGRLDQRGAQAVVLVDGFELLADGAASTHLRLVVAHDCWPDRGCCRPWRRLDEMRTRRPARSTPWRLQCRDSPRPCRLARGRTATVPSRHCAVE